MNCPNCGSEMKKNIGVRAALFICPKCDKRILTSLKETYRGKMKIKPPCVQTRILDSSSRKCGHEEKVKDGEKE